MQSLVYPVPERLRGVRLAALEEVGAEHTGSGRVAQQVGDDAGALLDGGEGGVATEGPDDLPRAALPVDDGDTAEARRFYRRDPEVLERLRELIRVDAEAGGVQQHPRSPV